MNNKKLTTAKKVKNTKNAYAQHNFDCADASVSSLRIDANVAVDINSFGSILANVRIKKYYKNGYIYMLAPACLPDNNSIIKNLFLYFKMLLCENSPPLANRL